MGDRELLERSKSPTSKKRYVGIEIEFLLSQGLNEAKLEKLLIENELQWYCHLGQDGSVADLDFVPRYENRQYNDWQGRVATQQFIANHMERKNGNEIRILAPENEVLEVVKKVCKVIKECNGIVNNTCGLHVHVDLRSRDYNTVYHNMFMVQNLMFKTQPLSRTSKNKYCKKLRRMFGPKSNAGRYYAINRAAYKEHRTIEVRLHEPTLVAKEIIMWTKFLIQIANLESKLDKSVSTVEELSWLPESLKGYLNERIQKYSRKSNSKTA